ncbi:MAG: helix-turn-helix domain-containing protein [Oscillospiraceae bacterium]|nr:helix-turn-helix domain-containing protein [Oscillospiraceae bacterium]
MYEEDFPIRLAKLRTQKGVSARDMSLSIGQNPGYINNIESGKSFPSMSTFFYICEYLNISPMDFFDFGNSVPEKLNDIIADLKALSPKQLDGIATVIKELRK